MLSFSFSGMWSPAQREHVLIWPTSRGGLPAVSQAHRAAAVLTAFCPRRSMQALTAQQMRVLKQPNWPLLRRSWTTCAARAVAPCTASAGRGPKSVSFSCPHHLKIVSPRSCHLSCPREVQECAWNGNIFSPACRQEVGRTFKLYLYCLQYGDICKRARHLWRLHIDTKQMKQTSREQSCVLSIGPSNQILKSGDFVLSLGPNKSENWSIIHTFLEDLETRDPDVYY